MPYNPDKHHRRSIRLDGYDYTQVGAYFVTMCVQNNMRLFGTIHDGEVQMNDAGWMVEHWWSVLPSKFPSVATDAFVVMPNHIHGIIVINEHNAGNAVRADQCVRPDACNAGAHAGAPLHDAADAVRADQRVRPDAHDAGNAVRPTLGTIIQWFKTMTTNAYIQYVHEQGWPQFDRRLWHRNYYEHIICNEADLHRVRTYIANNPSQWNQK